MASPVAILTGDFIGSTDAAPDMLDRAMAELAATATDIDAWTQGDTRFTRFRGDGWQLHLALPSLSLRAALILVARLRAANLGLRTRIAIGIGPADSLGSADLGDARGEAFELSGRTLDGMKGWQSLDIAGDSITDLHWAILQLLAERTGRWTPQQAEAAALALIRLHENPTQERLATELGISAQAMSYRFQGAGWREIRAAVGIWERDIDTASEQGAPTS